jgi:hypothetical protein
MYPVKCASRLHVRRNNLSWLVVSLSTLFPWGHKKREHSFTVTTHYFFLPDTRHLSTTDICAWGLWLQTFVQDNRPLGKYQESITRECRFVSFFEERRRLHHEKSNVVTRDMLTVTKYLNQFRKAGHTACTRVSRFAFLSGPHTAQVLPVGIYCWQIWSTSAIHFFNWATLVFVQLKISWLFEIFTKVLYAMFSFPSRRRSLTQTVTNDFMNIFSSLFHALQLLT